MTDGVNAMPPPPLLPEGWRHQRCGSHVEGNAPRRVLCRYYPIPLSLGQQCAASADADTHPPELYMTSVLVFYIPLTVQSIRALDDN